MDESCSTSPSPIVKGDRFSLDQYLKNDLEWEHMRDIPYASGVGSLMYAQVCTISDIAYVVGVLGRPHSNPGVDHWKGAKKVMRLPSGYEAVHVDVQTNRLFRGDWLL